MHLTFPLFVLVEALREVGVAVVLAEIIWEFNFATS